MQIKSVIIDNIHYINFIKFYMNTFFLDLPRWNWCTSYTPSNTAVYFPTCKELENTATTESVLSFAKYESHQELLSKEFQEKFRDFSPFEHQFPLFLMRFTFYVAKAEEILQIEILEMQSDSALRTKYLELGMGYLVSFHTFMKSLKTSENLR